MKVMYQLNKITRKCFLTLSVLGLLSISHMSADHHNEKNALSFKMKSIQDKDVDLKNYKGKVVLMVNVASKCTCLLRLP